MLETAAWLSLWDENVATEVIRRAPFLLFTAGDPASLPSSTRQAVLTALIEWMRRDEEIPLLDIGSLARFAQPDVAPALRTIWETDKGNAEIRRFVLRLVWLGKLAECADLAEAASFGRYQDLYTAITASLAMSEVPPANIAPRHGSVPYAAIAISPQGGMGDVKPGDSQVAGTSWVRSTCTPSPTVRWWCVRRVSRIAGLAPCGAARE